MTCDSGLRGRVGSGGGWAAVLCGLGLVWAGVVLGAAEWVDRGGGIRSRELPRVDEGRVGFRRMPAGVTGVGFTNLLRDERSVTNRNLLSGSGVACGDVDGDGRCDLYFCGIDSGNVLYRNLGGWRFVDITLEAGVRCAERDSTGAVLADIDGDGDLDLLVNSFTGGTRLFLNDGGGKFREATDAAGLRSGTGSTSMALADVDGDGDLDLYVANFRPTTVLDEPTARFQYRMEGGKPSVTMFNGHSTGEPEYRDRFAIGPSGDVLEFGQPDVLWLNDGAGRFKAVEWTGGAFLDEEGRALTTPPRDWGLACRFGDLNGDRRPDLYVCNDLHTPDRLWLNESTNGRVRFRAISRTALRSNSTFSMGVDFADVNRDGFVDFFTVDMLSRRREWRQTQLASASPYGHVPGTMEERVQVRRNALQMNRGDATFAEVGRWAGVDASEWSWGPVFLDVDLDGFEDLLITNGQLRDFQDSDGAMRVESAQRGKTLTLEMMRELLRGFRRLDTPNLAFRNAGDGRFVDVSREWGFGDAGISQGMALADLDDDGDLDVVVNNLNEAAGLYRNEAGAMRVAVRLRGSGRNTRGIGAQIQVTGAGVEQRSEMIAGGRYLSGDDAERVFAAGSATNRLVVDVHWPSGRRSRHDSLEPGRVYEISEPEVSTVGGSVGVARTGGGTGKLFEDVSARLGHVGREEPFDDFARQPLLPRQLSLLGPGVAWSDLDGDGDDDLVIGTGKGGMLGIHRNDGSGGFQAMQDGGWQKVARRDTTGLVTMGGMILAGSSNYEDGLTNGGWVRVVDVVRKASGELVLGQTASAGPLAMADVDGDGVLDLFVGGRVIPGRYPEPADSLILRQVGGRFVPHQRLERVGLVSGACFSDVDGDGDPDLLLACEWGPVRVLINEAGRYRDDTRRLGLERYSGWWTGVVAGDFDEDGRMDWVAGNWGENGRAMASGDAPWKVRHADLSGNGMLDLFETSTEPGTGVEWPVREYPVVARVWPWVRDAFPTFEAYAKATADAVAGAWMKGAVASEVRTLATTVFLNRGDRMEVRALPAAAQWSPALAVCVGDVDGDGHEDVFLGQNFFPNEPMTPRDDAGRGLWLRGDGLGGFVARMDSGVEAYGDARGAALADFDRDGRVDLVVAQNSGPTMLFRNVGAEPGLRVRMEGGPGNPGGIGAVIRARVGGRYGAAREIHAGAGYWSQDSVTQVLARRGGVDAIQVRWPWGGVTEHPVSQGATELILRR